MNIAIIGYGKMGHAIAELAKAQGIVVASIIDPKDPGANYRSITPESLKGADVAIDFTTPSEVVHNVELIAKSRKNIVIGTTGWYDEIEKVRSIVKKQRIGLVYGPNFSIGVNLFFRMVRNASTLMDRFPMYDPFVYEIHHRQKTDAPGGTAKILGEIVVSSLKRKKRLAVDRIDGRKIAPDELQVASIRGGHVPGTHVVSFDGEYDTIELKHTARSRQGFAEGALSAATWINGKKGLYTLDRMISDMAGE